MRVLLLSSTKGKIMSYWEIKEANVLRWFLLSMSSSGRLPISDGTTVYLRNKITWRKKKMTKSKKALTWMAFVLFSAAIIFNIDTLFALPGFTIGWQVILFFWVFMISAAITVQCIKKN